MFSWRGGGRARRESGKQGVKIIIQLVQELLIGKCCFGDFFILFFSPAWSFPSVCLFACAYVCVCVCMGEGVVVVVYMVGWGA